MSFLAECTFIPATYVHAPFYQIQRGKARQDQPTLITDACVDTMGISWLLG
jgi:hypothetical protein